MPRMTRAHFNLIAQAIKDAREDALINRKRDVTMDELIPWIADALEETNPAFSRLLFLDAVTPAPEYAKLAQ